jgi:hypothetical protein
MLAAFAVSASDASTIRSIHSCARSCFARIRMPPDQLIRWRSVQFFAPSDMVATDLKVNGQELIGEALSRCHARFYGEGVVVDLSDCGSRREPLRIRATTIDSNTVILHLHYRVG